MWTNNSNFQDRNIYYHIFTLYNQHIRIEITNGNQWKPMETNEHLKLELEKISRVISVALRNFFRLQWVHQDDPRCTKSPPKELQSHRATSALRTWDLRWELRAAEICWDLLRVEISDDGLWSLWKFDEVWGLQMLQMLQFTRRGLCGILAILAAL